MANKPQTNMERIMETFRKAGVPVTDDTATRPRSATFVGTPVEAGKKKPPR